MEYMDTKEEELIELFCISHYEYCAFWSTAYPPLSKLGCFSSFQSV